MYLCVYIWLTIIDRDATLDYSVEPGWLEGLYIADRFYDLVTYSYNRMCVILCALDPLIVARSLLTGNVTLVGGVQGGTFSGIHAPLMYTGTAACHSAHREQRVLREGNWSTIASGAFAGSNITELRSEVEIIASRHLTILTDLGTIALSCAMLLYSMAAVTITMKIQHSLDQLLMGHLTISHATTCKPAISHTTTKLNLSAHRVINATVGQVMGAGLLPPVKQLSVTPVLAGRLTHVDKGCCM